MNNCLLCGEPSSFTIGFIPDDPLFYQIEEGASIFYGLCEMCFNIPARENMAEQIIYFYQSKQHEQTSQCCIGIC